MLNFLEAFTYLTFFWLFIFCPAFRQDVYSNWKNSGWFGRLDLIVEALSSLFCGFILPGLLLWWFFE